MMVRFVMSVMVVDGSVKMGGYDGDGDVVDGSVTG